jgi:ribonuclease J
VICLVQPMPAGTAAYRGRAAAEPDSRPASRGRRDSGRDGGREPGRAPAERTPVPVAAGDRASRPSEPVVELEPAGRTRRRRSAAAS